MQLLYFADPLCSWCYGFGPELTRLLEGRSAARLDLVMGGLRPYNEQPMSTEFREMLRGHWKHVADASGLPFSEAILAREGFVYDTEPACRAVVTARDIHAASAYGYLKAVQAAFYRDGRDATQAQVLADIAAESGYGREAFLERLESAAMREAVRGDFATSQSMGVNGFPTVGVRHGPQVYLVTSGFVNADVMENRLDQIERLAAEKAVR
jgi:putative protein-disulfide isomerase